jgi:tetratricopeptide (TPR) repeat protein
LFHHKWAQQILAGDIFSLQQGDVLYKPPFYPYFMAVVTLLSGSSYFAPRFIQIVLGSFNCVFVYLIAARYFSRKSSVIAWLIYSFYFVTIYFDVEIEIPCVAIFFTLFSFYLIKQKVKWPSLLFSGFLFGLSVLTLPTNLLLVPLYLWILLRNCGLRKTAVYFVIVVLVLAPCTLRNVIYGKHFVLISANGGINFYIGNNKHVDKTISIQPGSAWERFSSQPYAFKGITSKAGEDHYWYEKSFKYIRENPVNYMGLLLKKSVIYFMNYEIMRNRDIYYAWNESFFRKIPFLSLFLIFPAGIAGLLLSFKQAKKNFDLYMFLILLILPCILFFVTSRYRLPSISLWSIFAGSFFTSAGEYIKAKKWQALTCLLVMLVLIGLVSRLNFFVIRNPKSRPHYNLGYIYSIKKDYDKALEHYHRCFELIEVNGLVDRITKAEVAMRIGIIYNIIDQINLSLLYLDKATRIFPGYGEAYLNKGITCLKADKNETAYENFLKSFECGDIKGHIFDFFLKALNRTTPSVESIKATIESSKNSKLHVMLYNYLGAQQIKKGTILKATDYFKKAYELAPTDSTTAANLKFIALKNNDAKGAGFYHAIKGVEGKDYNYYFNYGVEEGKTGHLGSALEYLLQASRFRETASVYYNLGLVQFKLGEHGEAVSYLRKSLEIDKGKEDARTLLEFILNQRRPE